MESGGELSYGQGAQRSQPIDDLQPNRANNRGGLRAIDYNVHRFG
jgi:hypothetical protein